MVWDRYAYPKWGGPGAARLSLLKTSWRARFSVSVSRSENRNPNTQIRNPYRNFRKHSNNKPNFCFFTIWHDHAKASWLNRSSIDNQSRCHVFSQIYIKITNFYFFNFNGLNNREGNKREYLPWRWRFMCPPRAWDLQNLREQNLHS